MAEHINRGTCSKSVSFDIVDGTVRNVSFQGGCNGNLKGIASLVEGLPADQVVQRLEGITCGPRQTSCPDQLARHLRSELSGSNA